MRKRIVSYKFWASLLALIAIPLGLMPVVAWGLLCNWDAAAMNDPATLFSLVVGSENGKWLQWAMIGDALGYYVLLLPVIIGLFLDLKKRGAPLPWVSLVAVVGMFYAINGAIGAFSLSVVMSFLSTQQVSAISEAVYQVVSTVVGRGIWATGGALLGGSYWFLTGIMIAIYRKGRLYGALTSILGVCYLAQGEILLRLFPPLASISGFNTMIYLLGALAWGLYAALHLDEN